ncbi:MAG: sodium:solute symporter family protein [Flammeovirgaceae bacterium]
MLFIVSAALTVSFLVYLFIGIKLGRSTKSVADMLPIAQGKQAAVKNSNEFSSSTVASTISLATVVVAFFELAPNLGVWLYWCVFTTSLGIWVVRWIAPKIWKRLAHYPNRPSLHEFLGTEFNSNTVALIGAICTSLGFLGAFAVELTVGSRFLAGLIPGLPQWAVVAVLCTVAFIYTSYGGFRAVIVTDKFQMIAIWLLLIALSSFIIYMIIQNGGWDDSVAKIPDNIKTFNWQDGLASFMIGIFIMNVLSYASDMSLWQRISASDEPKTVLKGLWASVTISGVTWTIIVSLSCLIFVVISPVKGENPLITLLAYTGYQAGVFGKIILFFGVLGLFGAMLSTASTQLIAVSHTIYEDISAKFRKVSLNDRLESRRELNISRIILVYAALIAIIIVELLAYYGYSVVDLIFAVFGAQLSMFPPILMGLLLGKEQLKPLAKYAAAAIIIGFSSGWLMLIDKNLSSNSPTVSVCVSGAIMLIGYLDILVFRKKKI